MLSLLVYCIYCTTNNMQMVLNDKQGKLKMQQMTFAILTLYLFRFARLSEVYVLRTEKIRFRVQD